MIGCWLLRCYVVRSGSGNPEGSKPLAGGLSVATPPGNTRLSPLESLGKLLGKRVRSGVRDDVHVLRHIGPGLCFSCIVPGLQLLDLGDVMTAMSLQQAFEGILGEVRIGAAQKGRDLGGVAEQHRPV